MHRLDANPLLKTKSVAENVAAESTPPENV
jgi:hypothetical protein